jgi:hypothetical protein
MVFAAFARRRSVAEVQRLMAQPETPAAVLARVDATVRRLLQEQAQQEAQAQQQGQAAAADGTEATLSSSTGFGKSSSRPAPPRQASSAPGTVTAAPDSASDSDAAASADSGAGGTAKATQGGTTADTLPPERKVSLWHVTECMCIVSQVRASSSKMGSTHNPLQAV